MLRLTNEGMGLPGVRYPKERDAPIAHAHTSTLTHTNTHTWRIAPGVDDTAHNEGTPPPTGTNHHYLEALSFYTEREQTRQLVGHLSYKYAKGWFTPKCEPKCSKEIRYDHCNNTNKTDYVWG